VNGFCSVGRQARAQAEGHDLNWTIAAYTENVCRDCSATPRIPIFRLLKPFSRDPNLAQRKLR
jgi:hypothetical protein